MTNGTSRKNSSAALLIAILTFLTVILANPLPAGAQQETTPTPQSATPPQTKATHRPNPDASGIYHVGDGVTPPKLIYSVEPELSEKARKAKLAGATRLILIVEADGHVRDIRVLQSSANASMNKKDREAALTMDQQAIKAASQYRFEPAQYNGKPVPVVLSIIMNFQTF